MFFVAYAWPTLDPGLSQGLAAAMWTVTGVVWVVFALDFGIRLVLTDHRGTYLLAHWYDVAFILLPALRPLVLFRYLVKVRINGRRFWRGAATR